MSAERLRQAADRLDALAEAATDGDGPTYGMPWVAEPQAGTLYEIYVDTMHPGVGKALAAWLRAEADTAMFPDDPADPHALAVADAILGGAA